MGTGWSTIGVFLWIDGSPATKVCLMFRSRTLCACFGSPLTKFAKRYVMQIDDPFVVLPLGAYSEEVTREVRFWTFQAIFLSYKSQSV